MTQQKSTINEIIIQGENLFNEGKIEDAEKYLLSVLSQHATNSGINNNLGAIKYSQGYFTTAKEYFLTALAFDDNNLDALSNLKEIYKNYNLLQECPQSLIDINKPAQFFAEIIKINPENPLIHNDIGLIQLKAEQLEKAEQSFLKAINIDPFYQEAYYNLGKIHISYGRYVEAIDNFITAIMINPKNEIAQRAASEYQNEEMSGRIGEKYKEILIVMEEDAEHVEALTPTLKTIKKLLPECHITLFCCESALKAVQKSETVHRVITQPDEQIYDIGILTIWSSNVISLHRSWLFENCKQFFFPGFLKGQDEPDSHFHIARCLGYIDDNPAYLYNRANINNFHYLKETGKKSSDISSSTQDKDILNSKKQFFIGGTGRSGTSILMKILNGHHELASFGEVKVLMHGMSDLQQIIKQAPENRENIVEAFKHKWSNDYFEFIMPFKHDNKDDSRRGLFQWFDKVDILNCLPILDDLNQSLNIQSAFYVFGVFVQNLFDRYAIKNNKHYWVEKTTANAVYAPALSLCFPNFKIVNMIRDGRDVACSAQNMTWGIEDPYKAIDWWASELKKSLDAQKYLPPDSFLNVRYEDLVDDPETTLKKVISFFDIEWDKNLLNEPIYSKAIKRYKTEMSEEVQKYALRQYGHLFKQFNYLK